MANGGSTILILAAGYLLYTSGVLDKLLKQGADKKETPDTPPTGGTPATGSTPTTGSNPANDALKCPMNSQQFVGAYGSGYVVFWGGKQVLGPVDKATAEQYYNKLCDGS